MIIYNLNFIATREEKWKIHEFKCFGYVHSKDELFKLNFNSYENDAWDACLWMKYKIVNFNTCS